MSNFLFGSICLSDIPREQMKKVRCKDGKERVYLSISIVEKRQPQEMNGKLYTHFVSCAPKKEERDENTNYIIGDLQTYNPQPLTPTAEDIANAPAVEDGDLPF